MPLPPPLEANNGEALSVLRMNAIELSGKHLTVAGCLKV